MSVLAYTTTRREDLPRRGATLLEALVMIAILSLVLTAVSVTMATLWREQRGIQDDLSQQVAMDFFAAQLRGDAHASQDAELIEGPDEAPGLRLLQPEYRVEYISERNRIRRTQYRNNDIVHREEYALAENATVSCKLVNGPQQRIRLTIERRNSLLDGSRPNDHRPSNAAVEQIEATIGLLFEDP